jgi:HK97 gp10 family phage protein
MMKIDVIGDKEALKFISDKDKNTKIQTVKALTDSALFIEGEVKESIAGRKAEPRSVDTGRFLNSVTNKVGKDDAIIYTDVEYAKFLEYGTSRIAARMHFRNSANRNINNVKAIFIDKIKNI